MDSNASSNPPLEDTAKSTSLRGEKGNSNDYQFVTLTANPHQNKGSNSAVRSHVMKDFLNRQVTRSKVTNPDEDTSQIAKKINLTAVKTQQIRKFRLGPWGLQQRPTPLRKPRSGKKYDSRAVKDAYETNRESTMALAQSLQTEPRPDLPPLQWSQQSHSFSKLSYLDPGATTPDPVDSLPLPTSPRMQYLLQYSSRHVNTWPYMMHPKKKWFELATKDQAYFHAALSHYAGHLSLQQKSGDPMEAFIHRMEAVKIINERLPTLELATCEGTICAVACIVNYESFNGTEESVRTHLSGLQKMVHMKGGLKASIFTSAAYRLVAWADVNSANALLSYPVFPAIERDIEPTTGSDNTPSKEHNCILSAETSIPSIPNSLQRSSVLGPALEAVFQEFQRLTRMSTNNPQIDALKMDIYWYSDTLYELKRKLLISRNKSSSKDLESYLISSCCSAAIILLDIIFRGTNINSCLISKLVTRIQHEMEFIPLDSLFILSDQLYLKYMLWVLFIGGSAAANRSEQPWFVEKAAEVCNRLYITKWTDVEVILDSILWDSTWTLPYEIFWSKVDRTRGRLGREQ